MIDLQSANSKMDSASTRQDVRLTPAADPLALGVLAATATYPLTITEILARCPHTAAERASWPRRGSYAEHAAQFPDAR